MPEDSAPSTKYLRPASLERTSSRPERGNDVECQALQLEPQIEGDQVAGRNHHHHAGGGQQHQHADIRTVNDRRLAHVVKGQEQGAGRADQNQKLHKARKVIDHKGAVEHPLRPRQLRQQPPKRHDNDGEGQPADTLRLPLGLWPGHTEEQERHGPDDEHDLRDQRLKGEGESLMIYFSDAPCGRPLQKAF